MATGLRFEDRRPAVTDAPHRLRGLDGLRGVAALAVVLSHTSLITPAVSSEYIAAYLGRAQVERDSFTWWATYTPLHVLWDGTGAVFVFFVLSGYVLGLPFASHRDVRWIRYYPKRLIRLYLPVWGALVVALASITLVERDFSPAVSWWLRLHPSDFDGAAIWQNLLLLPSGSLALNTVLWTLRYEVMFSLLLPLVVWFCRCLPRWNPVKGVLLLAATGVFYTPYGAPDLSFLLPVFTLGTLLVFERSRLNRLGAQIRGARSAGAIWMVLSAATIAAITAPWTLRGFTTDREVIPRIAACPHGGRRGGCGVPRLRGRVAGTARTTAAGLAGQPILQSLPSARADRRGRGRAAGRPAEPPLSLAIAVPIALLVAEVFFRIVERPSQRLARAAGRG